ncbi:hypothetical protein TNCV_1192631 [Trichonephila clavipes]|nr:hypothetical protein TNCV_1192631 [Trichonephila clavipes]
MTLQATCLLAEVVGDEIRGVRRMWQNSCFRFWKKVRTRRDQSAGVLPCKASMIAQPIILVFSFGSTHANDTGCLHRALCLQCVLQGYIPDAQCPAHQRTPIA